MNLGLWTYLHLCTCIYALIHILCLSLIYYSFVVDSAHLLPYRFWKLSNMKKEFNAWGYPSGIKPTTFSMKRIPARRKQDNTGSSEASGWQNHTKNKKWHQLEPKICFSFAQCQMIMLLMRWTSQTSKSSDKGLRPLLRDLIQIKQMQDHSAIIAECPSPLPSRHHFQDLFQWFTEF